MVEHLQSIENMPKNAIWRWRMLKIDVIYDSSDCELLIYFSISARTRRRQTGKKREKRKKEEQKKRAKSSSGWVESERRRKANDIIGLVNQQALKAHFWKWWDEKSGFNCIVDHRTQSKLSQVVARVSTMSWSGMPECMYICRKM